MIDANTAGELEAEGELKGKGGEEAALSGEGEISCNGGPQAS